MAKRLLPVEAAVRKVELTLNLTGKRLEKKYISCEYCRFDWKNIPGGKPRWVKKYDFWNPWKEGMAPENPRPEKHGWYCFKYAGRPYHSYIYFDIIRKNEKGEIVPWRQGYHTTINGQDVIWNYETQQYEPAIRPGETDFYVLGTRNRYKCRVCRRFEAAKKE
jgi:hypothetical protein